jgi:hypothetical protein
MSEITNPLIFFAASVALVTYILYMILRKRKGERLGTSDREPEL